MKRVSGSFLVALTLAASAAGTQAHSNERLASGLDVALGKVISADALREGTRISSAGRYELDCRSTIGDRVSLTIKLRGRSVLFAYSTNGSILKGTSYVDVACRNVKRQVAKRTDKGYEFAFSGDLLVDDSSSAKVGEVETRVVCLPNMIAVRTEIEPSLPGTFSISGNNPFRQFFSLSDLEKWAETTLLTQDSRGWYHLNELIFSEDFLLERWGLNAQDLRRIIFGNLDSVLTVTANRDSAVTLNRYGKSGLSFSVAWRRSEWVERVVPWDKALSYTYSFAIEEGTRL